MPAPADLRARNLWRPLGWGTIAAMIAAPAVAMRFTSEVHWGPEDFGFAIVLLGGVGLAFELVVRRSDRAAYRAGAAVALAAALLTLWANAAVGIVGSEENDINMAFNLVPALALLAAAVARLRAAPMAYAMLFAAGAQLALGLAMQFAGHGVWPFTLALTATWLASVWLFRRAAR
ncbi:hypothetical protein [Sphingomonas baiyangensis]|uniref:Uncharacterized protein n=1 Tax=Sphingomonas baiyangensis TaxID=2572576 RepID=A0A4U1L2Q3_9SPHN|nr:hypothetical protein [Sphingomonas baiyangensis]TKD51167.1 hypothetical protein FBR43_10670 [Sphingomonas baiyangensis]